MSTADEIREFVFEKIIKPAKMRDEPEIVIRAGDIHHDMGLKNAMPSVCNALSGKKFAEFANLSLMERAGPRNGANVYFTFSMIGSNTPQSLDHQTTDPALPKSQAPPKSPAITKSIKAASSLDLTDAVVLVSCVKSKLPHPAPARELYTSTWFTKVRKIVEDRNADWYILSALHGLVSPNVMIAPYERTLNTLGVTDRRAWATETLDQLIPKIGKRNRIVFFAGMRYREFLVAPLRNIGLAVEVPMEGLSIGRQLAWLSAIK